MPTDTRLVDSTVEDQRKKKRVLESYIQSNLFSRAWLYSIVNTQSFYTPTNCELHRHLYPLSPFIHLPPFSHRFLSQKSRRSSQYRPKYQKIVLFSKHCRALFGFSLMLLHLCMKVDTDICNSYLSSYNDLRSHTDVHHTDRSCGHSDVLDQGQDIQ